jgi:hypothetical protein
MFEWAMSMGKMPLHMPQSSGGLQSFVEVGQAFKMTPGLDVQLKLSIKKTVKL